MRQQILLCNIESHWPKSTLQAFHLTRGASTESSLQRLNAFVLPKKKRTLWCAIFVWRRSHTSSLTSKAPRDTNLRALFFNLLKTLEIQAYLHFQTFSFSAMLWAPESDGIAFGLNFLLSSRPAMLEISNTAFDWWWLTAFISSPASTMQEIFFERKKA